MLLARALVGQPDLLLLDEPTNHLDIEAITWLETFLAEYSGAVMFVTHDRTFLQRLATRIVELDRGRLTSWPGDYATLPAAKGRDAGQRGGARREVRQEAGRGRGVAAPGHQGAADEKRRTRPRADGHACGTGGAARAGGQRTAPGRTGGRIGKTRVRSQARVQELRECRPLRRRKPAAPQTVVKDFSTRIIRGDRIGLIGPNGAGKTTLLRLLLGEIAPDTGEVRHGANVQIAYYDQQREQLDPELTVFETIGEGNDTVTSNGRTRHVHAYLRDFLFSDERARSPVKALSGGERNRLLLARLFTRAANVLVLDEPTNDLDLDTLELLEEQLVEWPGTLLLVSHDRAFLDNVVTSTLVFEEGGHVQEYVGGYEDWLRQRKTVEAGSLKSEAGGRKPQRERSTPQRAQKLSYKEQRELEGLPARIEALEAEQRALHERTGGAEFYKESPDAIRRRVGAGRCDRARSSSAPTRAGTSSSRGSLRTSPA